MKNTAKNTLMGFAMLLSTTAFAAEHGNTYTGPNGTTVTRSATTTQQTGPSGLVPVTTHSKSVTVTSAEGLTSTRNVTTTATRLTEYNGMTHTTSLDTAHDNVSHTGAVHKSTTPEALTKTHIGMTTTNESYHYGATQLVKDKYGKEIAHEGEVGKIVE